MNFNPGISRHTTFFYNYLSDVNECELGTHNCDRDASCINSNGTFNCLCNFGFLGNGVTCTVYYFNIIILKAFWDEIFVIRRIKLHDLISISLNVEYTVVESSLHNISSNYIGTFNALCSVTFLGKNITICTKRIELGFMLDRSGSIGLSNFDKTKSFIKDITHYFEISQNDTRVAVMSYATYSIVHFPFSREFVSQQDLHSAIDSIPYSGGGTNTAQALVKAYTDMFSASTGSIGA